MKLPSVLARLRRSRRASLTVFAATLAALVVAAVWFVGARSALAEAYARLGHRNQALAEAQVREQEAQLRVDYARSARELVAAATIAAAARLVTPAMHNYAKQLDIMVSLGRAKVDLTNAALLDASGELVVTSAQTLDTVSEMLQTYGGWSWRAVLATTSIGTAVGGVIAAGIAVASAHVYLASAESAHAHFTAAFPMRAEQVERELVANARRADIVGATPEPVARTVAQGFDYSD